MFLSCPCWVGNFRTWDEHLLTDEDTLLCSWLKQTPVDGSTSAAGSSELGDGSGTRWRQAGRDGHLRPAQGPCRRPHGRWHLHQADKQLGRCAEQRRRSAAAFHAGWMVPHWRVPSGRMRVDRLGSVRAWLWLPVAAAWTSRLPCRAGQHVRRTRLERDICSSRTRQ
jgi:hypothetical protein